MAHEEKKAYVPPEFKRAPKKAYVTPALVKRGDLREVAVLELLCEYR